MKQGKEDILLVTLRVIVVWLKETTFGKEIKLMHFSVQFSGEDAITDDERSRIWTRGSDTGTFFNSVFIQSRPVLLETNEDNYLNNRYDFNDVYVNAMKEFLKLEPRVGEGKALRVAIIA